MDTKKLYDKKYYESHLGDKYERTEVWLGFFSRIADRIIQEIHPKTVLDVGCAKGFLVEALRDRGVEAEGIDISEYAISEVREDIKPYCRVASATDELNKRYDLIVCIEVFEHINSIDLEKVLKNLCNHTDDILFSSTPFDYNEETHINVKPIESWVEQFYYQGFLHDIEYDVTYISIQAMRFRHQNKNVVQTMREYERVLFNKRQELVPLRHNFELLQERIRQLDLDNIKHAQEIDTLEQDHRRELDELRVRHDQELNEISSDLKKSYEDKEIFLEKQYQVKLNRLTEEKDNLSENNIILRDQIEFLKNEIVSYDKQIRHLIDESLFYQQQLRDTKKEIESYDKQVHHLIDESLFYQQKLQTTEKNYENSTCWRITKPVRWIGKFFGRS